MNVPIGAHKGTSTPKATPDAIIAAELQLPVDAVLRHRLKFNDDAILRAVFEYRIDQTIAEKVRMLESVEESELHKLQGAIAGLRTAKAIILREEK